MARQLVVLLLVLVAVIGVVSVDEGPPIRPVGTAAAPPKDDGTVGTKGNDASAPSEAQPAAGPLGSEQGTAANNHGTTAASNGATTFRISAVAGAAAVGAYFVF